MIATKNIIFLTFSIAFCACRQISSKEKPIHPDWTNLTLPNGWTIQAPQGFKIKRVQGVDSHPGYIFNPVDSITFDFDSGIEFSTEDNCDFEKQIKEQKNKITLDYYKKLYKIPELNRVYLDTIDNKVAKIIVPNLIGKGLVSVSISDCKSGAWLGIHGYNLNLHNQKLVLEMFQTITRNNNNAP